MTDNVLRLAAFAHELTAKDHEGQELLSGVQGLLTSSEKEAFAESFAKLDDRDFEALAYQAIELLVAAKSEAVTEALGEAFQLVDDAPRQHMGLTDALVIGTALSVLGTAFAVAIIFVSRIAKIKRGGLEITFYEGLPDGVTTVVDSVTQSGRTLTDIVDRAVSRRPGELPDHVLRD